METNYDSFYCPITGEIMQDPTILPDGYSYERKAIEQYLIQNGKSPMTAQAFAISDLIPNRALQEQINQTPKQKLALKVKPKVVDIKDFQQSLQPKDLTLEASLGEEGYVKFTIGIDDIEECPPVDVVAVVDISASMKESCAGITDGRTVYVEKGFSLLDLVKHAMKTIIKTLRPQDRLAIIQFDDFADICQDFKEMNELGQDIAFVIIDNLQGRFATNILNAIVEALKLVEKRKDKSRNPAILFFTDGVPNDSPKEGEIEVLKKIKAQYQVACPIHTYGFGQYYRLNSELLYGISKLYNSMNGYIPDPTNIGTTFVNAISNILTTAAIDVKFQMDVGDIREDIQQIIIGDLSNQITEDGNLIIDIGCVRFGQPIEFLIKFDPEKIQQYNFQKYSIHFETQGQKNETQGRTMLEREDHSQFLPHIFRFQTIELIKKLILTNSSNLEANQQELKQHIENWENQNLTDKVSMGILQNLKDQISTAMKKTKYLDKWGKHQLRQLVRALNLQVKSNFRDPAVANFGGKLFQTFADTADEIFNNLKPPKPSKLKQAKEILEQNVDQKIEQKVESKFQHQYYPQVIEEPQDFAEIYNNVNCGAGCFTGNCKVQMNYGRNKLVKDLQKGDIVATPQGQARILCVLKIKIEKQMKLCRFESGLEISHHHPIKHQGEWKFPSSIIKPETMFCEEVYNLILDKDNIAIINGIQVICLGHEYQTGILKNNYLGSKEVIKDLERMPGWSEGCISLKDGCFIKQNGQRSKIIYKSE